MIYEKIRALLDKCHVTYQIFEHTPVRTIEDARELVPHLSHNLLKTVVFRIKDGNWILAAIQSDKQIHYKKLADALGVKRTELRSISAKEVESEIGYQIGGVGPFPIRTDVDVIFDESLKKFTRVFCGSGRNDRTIQILFSDLLTVSGGKIHPLSMHSIEKTNH